MTSLVPAGQQGVITPANQAAYARFEKRLFECVPASSARIESLRSLLTEMFNILEQDGIREEDMELTGLYDSKAPLLHNVLGYERHRFYIDDTYTLNEDEEIMIRLKQNKITDEIELTNARRVFNRFAQDIGRFQIKRDEQVVLHSLLPVIACRKRKNKLQDLLVIFDYGKVLVAETKNATHIPAIVIDEISSLDRRSFSMHFKCYMKPPTQTERVRQLLEAQNDLEQGNFAPDSPLALSIADIPRERERIEAYIEELTEQHYLDVTLVRKVRRAYSNPKARLLLNSHAVDINVISTAMARFLRTKFYDEVMDTLARKHPPAGQAKMYLEQMAMKLDTAPQRTLKRTGNNFVSSSDKLHRNLVKHRALFEYLLKGEDDDEDLYEQFTVILERAEERIRQRLDTAPVDLLYSSTTLDDDNETEREVGFGTIIDSVVPQKREIFASPHEAALQQG